MEPSGSHLDAILIATCALFLLRSGAVGWAAGQWVFGVSLPAVFAHGCAQVRRRQRTEEALVDGLCPDRNYLLEEKVEGTGPERCPECGGVWPLVPPCV
jgi:hypothetical protein